MFKPLHKAPLLGFMLLLLLLGKQPGYAQTIVMARALPQEQPVTSKPAALQLKDVLNQLKTQYQVDILFELKTVEGLTVPSTTVSKNLNLERNLEKVLTPFGLRYKKVNSSSYMVLGEKKAKKTAEADLSPGRSTSKTDRSPTGYLEQSEIGEVSPPGSTSISTRTADRTLRGKVTDETGAGLPGVSVVQKGTQRGTTTDAEGDFQLTVPDGAAVLVFSFVGYLSQEIEVLNQTTLTVSLKGDTKSLEEVVVVGYGTARKKDLTGAVASVNIEDTRLQPNTNATQMLRGTTAGVQVTDNGRPGQNGSINIRGINSISASNSPLIVLDGIIYAGGSLADINPNDIESIDVLKDASSTAIYGSLAANGVIEITTKKGKLGKPKFALNTYMGFSDYAFLPDLLTPEQYLAARKDAEIADGGPVPFWPSELANIAANRTINPFEEIRQSAPMSNYELSVAGKTDRLNYFFSGAYTTAKSPVRGDNFGRISSRLNLSVQATDWLKLGVNSGFSSRDDSGNRVDLGAVTQLSPFAQLYLEDGVSPKPLPMDIGGVPSPIMSNVLNKRHSITNVLFTNIFAEMVIWKGLSYKINGGYTRTDSKLFQYAPAYKPVNRLGSGSKRHGENQNFTLENIVKYQQNIGQDHRLDLTMLYGLYDFKNQFSQLSSQNIFNDALGYNALEIGDNFNIDAGAAENKQISSMARLGYTLKGKYFVTLSIRRDGYSAFGAGNKFGVFPAAALSWNMSDEDFFKEIRQINFMKLRASWGRNGNRGVEEYSSLSQVTQGNYVFGDGSPTSVGLSPSTLANPNLGWETTESFNIGTDIEAFSSRIGASINFYQSNTFDLLLQQIIPNTNGFERFLRNIGETKNHGLEIDLKTVNIRRGDFEWNTRVAFSFNRNKIVKLTGRDLNNDGIEDDDIASRWFIGHPLGSNFDYVFDGIFQEGDDLSLIPGAQPGDIKFKDISGPDGVPDGKISPDDRTVVSNDQANFNMGITNILTFKGFSLTIALNSRQGGYSPVSMLNPGSNFYDQMNFLDVPYWTPENPINDYARINYRNPLGYGFYQSRSFVRLQDVSFAYSIPETITRRARLGSVQIYVSGKNLATWTKWMGWDPEFGEGGRSPRTNGPLLKTYVAGLNISF
ncbi:TonB-dependent receptor [Rhabdobacter roseus]|uniref:TonB-linked SusC/RagA family outer membrane protein n=1 Tax=Rhabdobacter roseus TaxID=1655419 RepID=A0A840TPX0_9BACT|nr:TonB-dependent receptor [Rhabdobacter roseus]MBB5286386.1 TonB-linked SusC/RagA family outer membrane protein [Rhabdobacter roseus]